MARTMHRIARVELELGGLYSPTIVDVRRGSLAPDPIEIDILPAPIFDADAAFEIGDGSAGAFRAFEAPRTVTGNGAAQGAWIEAGQDGLVRALAFRPSVAAAGRRVVIEIRGGFDE